MARRLTADKRGIKDFPKFAYRRTSFIRIRYMKLPALEKVVPIEMVKKKESEHSESRYGVKAK